MLRRASANIAKHSIFKRPLSTLSRAIERVITDGAGSACDTYCLSPTISFQESFLLRKKIDISNEEARGPMGIGKIEHIQQLLQDPIILAKFIKAHNRNPSGQDIQEIYETYQERQKINLKRFSKLTPGMLELSRYLIQKGIPLDFNTAYSRNEMKIVLAEMEKQGVVFHNAISSSDVRFSRPNKDMVEALKKKANIHSSRTVITLGDTPSDMKAAKDISIPVGIIGTSSLLNIESEAHAKSLSRKELKKRFDHAEKSLREAGAEFTIITLHQLPSLINKLEQQHAQMHSASRIRKNP